MVALDGGLQRRGDPDGVDATTAAPRRQGAAGHRGGNQKRSGAATQTEPLETGHDKAVLRTVAGKEESHFIRPVARSKVASVPVGVDAAFLIDELDKIVDVTFGSKEAVHRAAELWQKQSPLKGNLAQVSGTIVTPLKDNAIVIRTEDGRDHTYKVRPLIQTRVATLSKGDAAVLLVDDEHKVTDVAFTPDKKP